LIDMAGGETVDNASYVLGGPMMGGLCRRDDVVTKTTNAVIVLPSDHYVIMRKKQNPSIDLKRAMAACCQCRYCTDMCPRHLLGHPIEPHELMRVASNHDSRNTAPYLNTFFCSGCGLCEMYSCFQGLSPRTLIGKFKSGLKAAGVSAPKIEGEPKPTLNRELRRVPLSRLRARLDLEKYNKSAPITDDIIEPKEVKIMLSQHIGIPASPVVKKGDTVTKGQVIATAADGKLSVNIHSSINGKVTAVTEKFITVRR
ncbi:MAG: 4Fe-4S dicluster domain-containing protein, partial [Clostridia bacterium]|nr:4Fe-4S dicluster domain-containing protein [Clostridia bacterium]